MGAKRKFDHKGVTVLVYEKSVKLTGMHDCLFLGAPPDDDQIRRLIDAIQGAARSPAQRAWDRHNRPPTVQLERKPTVRARVPEEYRVLSLRERFLRWWYDL